MFIDLPNNLAIRPAFVEDAAMICSLSELAVMQKQNYLFNWVNRSKLKPDPEAVSKKELLLQSTYHSNYLISAPPFLSKHYMFDKKDGRQVCGYGGAFYNTNEPEMFLNSLYTVKSPHPCGSYLLQMFVTQAKQMNLESIRLRPLGPKSREWYKKSGSFEEISKYHKYIITGTLILQNKDFSKSIDKLQKVTGYSFDNSLDSLHPFP